MTGGRRVSIFLIPIATPNCSRPPCLVDRRAALDPHSTPDPVQHLQLCARQSVEDAGEVLRSPGAQVSHVPVPEAAPADALGSTLSGAEACVVHEKFKRYLRRGQLEEGFVRSSSVRD